MSAATSSSSAATTSLPTEGGVNPKPLIPLPCRNPARAPLLAVTARRIGARSGVGAVRPAETICGRLSGWTRRGTIAPPDQLVGLKDTDPLTGAASSAPTLGSTDDGTGSGPRSDQTLL